MLAEMFQVRPELALDVLEVLNFSIPEFDEAVVASAELNNVVPTEFRADRVVTFGRGKKPVFATIVEVQLKDNERKRFAWPAYVATLYSRLKCPVLLVVVCPDTKVARWAETPIVITDPGFFTMTPVALGPEQLPVVTDVALAETNPELVLLSTVLHRDKPDPVPRLTAAVAAIHKIFEATGTLYYGPIQAVSPMAHRTLLEDIMKAAGYESDFVRHHEARGEARALLAVLEGRKIDVPAEVRARIMGCSDMEQLDVWVRRAVTADSVGDLFD